MTPEERENALDQIKLVLLDTCRGSNTQIIRAIRRMSLTNLPGSYGIFDRLTTEGYIAGQSYPDEMRTVKEIIKKEC
jgi:hypothetical protein